MTVTVTNVLQGPAQVYVGTFGATEPANADAAPAVGWTDAGATDGGTTMAINQGYSKMVVDQIALAVGARLISQELRVGTTFAEFTLANLRTALNMASGAGTLLEVDSAISNANPNYAAVMLIGQRPGGGNRLVILRRSLSAENVQVPFQKDAKSGVPVSFDGYYVSSAIKAIKIDDTPGP